MYALIVFKDIYFSFNKRRSNNLTMREPASTTIFVLEQETYIHQFKYIKLFIQATLQRKTTITYNGILFLQFLNSTLESIIRERRTLVLRVRPTKVHPLYISVALDIT